MTKGTILCDNYFYLSVIKRYNFAIIKFGNNKLNQ